MKRAIFFSAILLTASLFLGCRKDAIEKYAYSEPVLPNDLHDYEAYQYPEHILNDHLLELILTFSDDNEVTNEGATLGRVLFYDQKLSANNTVSCGSCHHQHLGFTDGEKFSAGFKGELTGRNSMAIVNVDLNGRLFWDLRANSVEEQVLMPIEHPLEMGMDLNHLVKRLKEIDYYENLFSEAFGDAEITIDRIRLALGQFLRSIRSYQSKFDIGVQNDFTNFTDQELTGKTLFFDGGFGCANCHFTLNMGGVSRNVNGLDEFYKDQGIGALTGKPEDNGFFKAVSLRNIELTAPYMHDGRFETLYEVISFYSEGIQPHPNLDDRLTTDFSIGGPPAQFNFTEEEKQAFIAFLKTLTDWNMINNPAYSNPFPGE